MLVAALLHHLRGAGVDALAMKPFCSGARDDVALIRRIQGPRYSLDEVNPYYFKAPLSPWAALSAIGRKLVPLEVGRAIRKMEQRCDRLIVEGAGGVLVPLSVGFTVADLIAQLDCEVVVVGCNRLGTLNHTLMTVEALRSRGVQRLKIVLMEQEEGEMSARSNGRLLAEWLVPIEVYSLPFLGQGAARFEAIVKNSKKIKKLLARIHDPDTFTARSRG